jgi:hypothetical protein
MLATSESNVHHATSTPTTPGQREQYAFGQQLADQPAPACTNRCANRDFVEARGPSRQQKSGDVYACDEKDEDDGAQQDVGGRPVPTSVSIKQRLKTRRPSVRERRPAARGISENARELPLGLSDRQAAAKPAVRDGAGPAHRGHVRLNPEWPEDRGVALETLRQHADDLRILGVEPQLLADHVVSSGVSTLPVPVAEHDHRRRALLHVVVLYAASANRHDLEEIQVVRSNLIAAQTLGLRPVSDWRQPGDGFPHPDRKRRILRRADGVEVGSRRTEACRPCRSSARTSTSSSTSPRSDMQYRRIEMTSRSPSSSRYPMRA